MLELSEDHESRMVCDYFSCLFLNAEVLSEVWKRSRVLSISLVSRYKKIARHIVTCFQEP